MPQDKLAIHAEAVNLARRYSVQNENDLMQEDYCDTPTKKMWDHDSCAELGRHLLHPSSLPKECKQFSDVVLSLKRRDTDSTHPTSLMS
mmetsp:Transcript_19091/g.33635  ORF Transcript_19091/g.33635 Transcript_19091/m.33635 type:complete len:89 (-) Transcript_19091:364-630(-)